MFLAEVGFADNQRAITPPLTAPEAGWVFAAHAHCAGYAPEAGCCITAWADKNLEVPETACIFDPAHASSNHVARKCGYGDAVHIEYAGADTLIMTRKPQAVSHQGADRPGD